MTEPKEKIMKLISTVFAALLLTAGAAHADLSTTRTITLKALADTPSTNCKSKANPPLPM
jgi:hypothetical protein